MSDAIHTEPLKDQSNDLLKRIESLAIKAVELSHKRYEDLEKVVMADGENDFDSALLGLMTMRVFEAMTIKAFEQLLGLTIDEAVSIKQCCDGAIYYLLNLSGGVSDGDIKALTKQTDVSEIIKQCAKAREMGGNVDAATIEEAMRSYNESIEQVLKNRDKAL